MVIQYIEPFFVPDVYVDGVASVQQAAPDLWRLSFYSKQISAIDGAEERVICNKMLITRCNGFAVTKAVLRSWAAPAWVLLG